MGGEGCVFSLQIMFLCDYNNKWGIIRILVK